MQMKYFLSIMAIIGLSGCDKLPTKTQTTIASTTSQTVTTKTETPTTEIASSPENIDSEFKAQLDAEMENEAPSQESEPLIDPSVTTGNQCLNKEVISYIKNKIKDDIYKSFQRQNKNSYKNYFDDLQLENFVRNIDITLDDINSDSGDLTTGIQCNANFNFVQNDLEVSGQTNLNYYIKTVYDENGNSDIGIRGNFASILNSVSNAFSKYAYQQIKSEQAEEPLAKKQSSSNSGYKSMVMSKIYSNWSIPSHIDEVKLKASFNISPNGEISNIKISGDNEEVKESLKDAIQAINPLPSPPEDIYDNVKLFQMTFE